MRKHHLLLLALLLHVGLLSAKEGRDTLKTRTGDRLIIPYEYVVSGNDLTVRFRPALKRLGAENARRYKKLEDLTVIFFDRKGSFKDATFTGNLSPEAFMVPAALSYTMSEEGYYLLHDNPAITFRFRSGVEDVHLSIPAYLAQHVSKGRYKLIARCDDFEFSYKAPAVRPAQQAGSVTQTVTTSVEVESDNADMTRVLDCIANINSRLPLEDRLPMSESLEGDVRLLREWKYNVTDPHLKDKVNETLDAYELKKRKLEDAAAAAVQAQQRKAEEEQRKAEEEMKAQQEAQAAQEKEEAEKNQKKNIWTIIIGAVLAGGAVVGNQVLQTLRSKKSQENLMAMQQSMAKQVEDAAKKQFLGSADTPDNKTAKPAQKTAGTATRPAVGKAVGKLKNKKNITI